MNTTQKKYQRTISGVISRLVFFLFAEICSTEMLGTQLERSSVSNVDTFQLASFVIDCTCGLYRAYPQTNQQSRLIAAIADVHLLPLTRLCNSYFGNDQELFLAAVQLVQDYAGSHITYLPPQSSMVLYTAAASLLDSYVTRAQAHKTSVDGMMAEMSAFTQLYSTLSTKSVLDLSDEDFTASVQENEVSILCLCFRVCL